MNKGELIEALATETGETKAAVGRVLDALTATVVKQVKKGDSVSLLGFGTFKQTKRAARTGRNPRTGAPLKVAASKGVRFTAGAPFKAALNPKRK